MTFLNIVPFHVTLDRDINIENVLFKQISITGEGAAVYSNESYNIVSLHSFFDSCQATVRAGAIRTVSGSIFVNFTSCTNCSSRFGATIVSYSHVVKSDHYMNSFCKNTGSSHGLYPSGNEVSFLNCNATNNICNSVSDYGCAASFGYLISENNTIKMNNFYNCSKAPGIILFAPTKSSPRVSYLKNTHLFCESTNSIVTGANFNIPITMEECVFFGCVASNFVKGISLKLSRCKHDFTIQGDYEDCETISIYKSEVIKCPKYEIVSYNSEDTCMNNKNYNIFSIFELYAIIYL